MANPIAVYIERSLGATLDVVRAFPEEHHSFWPAPKTMTVAEQIEHLAHNLEYVIAPIPAALGMSVETVSADDGPVARLDKAVQNVRDVLGRIDDSDWEQDISYPGGFSMNVMQAALTILEHDAHHRGQLIVALRTLDIEPPRRWQSN